MIASQQNYRAAGLSAGIVVLLLAGISFTAAQIVTPGDIDMVQRGKADFEARCGTCHPLDVTSPRMADKTGWLNIIEKMVAEGAEVSEEEKERIASYLESKTLFENTCASCHPKERCLSRRKSSDDWTRTVKRMGLLVEGGIPKMNGRQIVSYLAVVCPEK